MPVGQIVKSAISFGVSKMPVLDKIRSTSFVVIYASNGGDK